MAPVSISRTYLRGRGLSFDITGICLSLRITRRGRNVQVDGQVHETSDGGSCSTGGKLLPAFSWCFENTSPRVQLSNVFRCRYLVCSDV